MNWVNIAQMNMKLAREDASFVHVPSIVGVLVVFFGKNNCCDVVIFEKSIGFMLVGFWCWLCGEMIGFIE